MVKDSLENTGYETMGDDECDVSSLPWTEKYRPSQLDELGIDESCGSSAKTIVAIKEFIDSNSFPHLLFYGPPGSGKTSTIIAAAKDMYKDNYHYMVKELNASDDRGIDVIRKVVKQFVSSGNILEVRGKSKFKLVILDEIDAQTKDAQFILRRIIENYGENARFCLICNDRNKIDLALQSRCTKFRFYPHTNDMVTTVVKKICKNENIKIGKDSICSLAEISNGDLRKCINILQSTYMTFKEITSENIYKSVVIIIIKYL